MKANYSRHSKKTKENSGAIDLMKIVIIIVIISDLYRSGSLDFCLISAWKSLPGGVIH